MAFFDERFKATSVRALASIVCLRHSYVIKDYWRIIPFT
jgi:hypothetical protein